MSSIQRFHSVGFVLLWPIISSSGSANATAILVPITVPYGSGEICLHRTGKNFPGV